MLLHQMETAMRVNLDMIKVPDHPKFMDSVDSYHSGQT